MGKRRGDIISQLGLEPEILITKKRRERSRIPDSPLNHVRNWLLFQCFECAATSLMDKSFVLVYNVMFVGRAYSYMREPTSRSQEFVA